MNKKYITVKGFEGYSYSKVAEIMTKSGEKMNHSSVRNYVTNGFCKIVKNISNNYDLKYSDEEIKKIAQSEDFQDSIIKIMKRG
tara:strand:- start:87 stop:338 length:252 start_codon:yes stop_codon:yes gene_type:complete